MKVESLAGSWVEDTEWTPGTNQTRQIQYSPCVGAAIAQDRLESILREKAIELGADIRHDTELLRFEQNSNGVTARLHQRNGAEYSIHATYMVAADGRRSPVRTALGIGRKGRGFIRTVGSVLFRAPLDEYLRDGVFLFNVEQPGLDGFLALCQDGRWILMFSDDRERDNSMLEKLIFKALGRSDLKVEILATGRWELSALIADAFSSNNVFLAGDAAHTLPPNRGGYGANTGIEDAHNLVWKLASVLSGTSAPQLLDTYDAERRPIAWLRHDQIFVRPDYENEANKTARGVPVFDDAAMEFGQLYRSSAVTGADPDLPSAMRPEQWAGQPGTRAPHLWVTKGEELLSTLDLFQQDWVLLGEDQRWASAAASVGDLLGINLVWVRIGADVLASNPEEFRKAFGLGSGGASLIRPDGYIAWRSTNSVTDPVRAVADALSSVLFANAAQHKLGCT
jgi:flavin-dependent dehydrogenase